MTSAHRLRAGALGLAMLLAACGGDSSLTIQMAQPPAPSTSTPASLPASTRAKPAASATSGAGPETAAAKAAPASAVAPGASPKLPPRATAASPSPGSAAAAGPVTVPATGQPLPAGARLVIPSIGVDAPVISLGVDADGRMQVPNNGTDVGWYTFSAAPGTGGNAVISGHLDTATSPTAVFSRLKDLKQGDAMSVVENGNNINFDVFWTKSWPDDTAPLALILGNAPSPTLTLITCSGTFDRASRNYSERLVVRAKLPGSL